MSMITFVDGNELTAAQLNSNFSNTLDITTVSPQTLASTLGVAGLTTTTLSATGASIFGAAEGHKETTVTASGTYVVVATDYVVSIFKTVAAASAVTLPTAPSTNRWLVIRDIKGDAVTNNITISGAQNINGAATFVLNQNYASVSLTYNTTAGAWFIM